MVSELPYSIKSN